MLLVSAEGVTENSASAIVGGDSSAGFFLHAVINVINAKIVIINFVFIILLLKY